jgi:acetate kinase
MMATRCGALDPGLLLYLQSECGIGITTMQDALARNSGLLGVSGVSADIRAVISAAAAGNEAARLAYERFILYGRRGLGAMSGSLGGVDAVVFTGGIGEHSAQVRHDLMRALGPDLIDRRRNEAARIGNSAPGTDVVEIGADLPRVLVIGAREDRIIARDVRAVAHAARV